VTHLDTPQAHIPLLQPPGTPFCLLVHCVLLCLLATLQNCKLFLGSGTTCNISNLLDYQQGFMHMDSPQH